MTRTFLMLAVLAAMCATGCDLPVSVHPLSDEKTSVIDERLIGVWEYVAQPGEEEGPQGVPPRWYLGRLAATENLHELVVLDLDGDGHVQVQRSALHAAKIGEHGYLSMIMNPVDPKEKQVYWIMHYTIDKDNTLRLMALDKAIVAPAIEREELKGIVRKSPPDPNAPPPEQVKPKYKEIRITAESAELSAWLAKQGPAAFLPESFTTLRRVEVK